MIENELELLADAGAMRVFCVSPGRSGAHPVAIICQDGPGYREELKDLARRFATSGYCCVLPDWTYRYGAQLDFTDAHVAGTELMRRVAGILNSPAETIVADTRHLLEFIRVNKIGDAGNVVTVGYCYGASCVIHLLAGFPDTIRAGAGFHPFWTNSEGKAPDMHLEGAPEPPDGRGLVPAPILAALDSVRGEIYFGVADHDAWISQADYRQFAAEMKKRKIAGEVEAYPGTHHGFSIQGSPNYQKEASERQYERTLELWRRATR
jgi:carboxymethylenebutenolidase